MTTYENLSVNQKVRAALHRDVSTICTEICHCMGLDITRPAEGIIAELVVSKLALYGLDLEAFAKHARRTTINSDDVKLLTRRNPSLTARLKKLCSENSSKIKKRKTTAPPGAESTKKKKQDVIVPNITCSNNVPANELIKPGPSKEEMMDTTIDLTISQ